MFRVGTVPRLAAGLSILVLAAACSSPAPVGTNSRASQALSSLVAPEVVPGEFLVRWKTGVPTTQISALHAAQQASVLRRSTSVKGLEHIRVQAGSAQSVLDAYRGDPRVEYIQPNYVIHAAALPDDTSFGTMWGLNNSGQSGGTIDADINAPEAWDVTTGSSTTVIAVIDSGIDYDHPDLAGNMWSNPMEAIGTAGVDDDGNGYIDDIHGIDAINDDSDPFDDNRHGTHCAGTIGAVGNNATGVTGVNWDVQLIACKILNAAGNGDVAAAIECLDYLEALKTSGTANVTITNNSWGAYFTDQALDDAIGSHAAADILFVAAAGNDTVDIDGLAHNPSSSFQPNVVAVAATNRFDGLASFSNYGRRSVHVGAPGRDILSTFPTSMGSYGTISGTSMATPHVAGLAGLLVSQDGTRSFWELKNLLMAGSEPISSLTAGTVTGRRERAFDSLIQGSLNCTSNIVQSRLRPIPDVAVVLAGSTVDVHAIDIVCEMPGSASIAVDVNAGESTLTLLDDGNAPDDFAGDGRYAGALLAAEGTYLLEFPWGETQTIVSTPPYVEVPTAYSPRTLVLSTGLNLTDETVQVIALPFEVRFSNRTFDLMAVQDNGFMSFTESSSGQTFDNQPLPVSQWTTLIAPFWDDLEPTAGQVRYAAQGTAPDRELIVEWNAVPHFDFGGAFHFQAVFFENRDDVLFNYIDVTHGTPSDNGASATIGVQQLSTAATQLSFQTASVADASSRLFVLAGGSGAPVVDAPAFTSGPHPEGTVIAATSFFYDLDGDGPWNVEWHSNGDTVPEFSEVAMAEGALAATVPLAQDGAFSVRVVVTDSGMNVGQGATDVDVTNVAPVLDPLQIETPPFREGVYNRFVSSFADPGVQDAEWILIWDYDNDLMTDDDAFLQTPGGIASSFIAFETEGPATVNAQVFDEDGFGDPSNIATIDFTIEDVDPVVTLSSAAIAGTSEPARFSFSLEALSGAVDFPDVDPITLVEWDLDGDGTFELATPGDVDYVENTFPDSGVHTSIVRVWDEDSSVDVTVQSTVVNVNPIAAAISDATVTEGDTVVIQAAATDAAGIHDPITWSLDSGPAGVTVTPTGVVAWTPSYAQSGRGAGTPHLIALACADGDGGTCATSFTLSAVVRDDDGDGMADTWEIANGLDPEVDDTAGDVDGDGVSNLDEYNNENGGPQTPQNVVATAPADDSEVTDEDPELTVTDALDDDSGPLTYVFQIAASETGFGAPLVQGSSLEGAGGVGGSTSIVFDGLLTDDAGNPNDVMLVDGTSYWWRAWARDDEGHNGPWTAPQGFLYNPVNSPPSMPGITAPVPGSSVGDTTPTLIAGNSTDDSLTRTYRFRVFSDAGLTAVVDDSGAIGEDPSGITAYTVDPALADDTPYWWSVTADDGNSASANLTGEFFVNLGNDEPSMPVLVGPTVGEILAQTAATLEVANSTDGEGDALTYLFEVDTTPSFNSADYQSSGDVAEGTNTTTHDVAGLSEDTTYWWRARASDGLSFGDFVQGTFRVNAANAAPSAAVAVSPTDDVIVPDITPTLEVQNAVDVEGDALTYVFTVLDEDGETIATSAAIPEDAGGFTAFTLPDETLKKGKIYSWTCVATDSLAASGAPSTTATFRVYKKSSGGGGGGCSCNVTEGDAGSGGMAGLAMMALGFLFRRRRRCL